MYCQRHKLKNSYVATMLDWIHPTTFALHKALIGLLPLAGKRHDGHTMAAAIAERIDRVTSDDQFLASGICDGGGNVKSAVAKVVHTYDELLAIDKSRLLSLFDVSHADRQPRAGGEDDDDGDDSEDEDESEHDDDVNAELEKHRTASCCAHIFSLVSKGLIAVDGVADVLSKADKLISSTRNSTLCQQRLEALQRAENDDVLCLLSPSKTRWNARVRAYSRLLRLLEYIRALRLRGCYDRRAGRVEMLDAHDEVVLKEVVKLMSLLDLGISSLEHNEHTLSSVAFVYSSVLKQCTLDERAAQLESVPARRLREHVVTDMRKRFADVLASEGNVALATLLDARYGPRMLQTLVGVRR